jgi:hypothetical protein
MEIPMFGEKFNGLRLLTSDFLLCKFSSILKPDMAAFAAIKVRTPGWTLPRMRREIQRLLFTWTGICAYCGCDAPTASRTRGP